MAANGSGRTSADLAAELNHDLDMENSNADGKVTLAEEDPRFPGVDVSRTGEGVRYDFGPQYDTLFIGNGHGDVKVAATAAGVAGLALKGAGALYNNAGGAAATFGSNVTSEALSATGAALRYTGIGASALGGGLQFVSGTVTDNPIDKLFGTLKVGSAGAAVIFAPVGLVAGIVTFAAEMIYRATTP